MLVVGLLPLQTPSSPSWQQPLRHGRTPGAAGTCCSLPELRSPAAGRDLLEGRDGTGRVGVEGGSGQW